MLDRLISFSLRQKGLILAAALMIVALGIYSYLHLPIDAFPDVTNVQVEIVCTAPGLAALEIERFVTHPVEMALRGLPHIEQMRSVTKFGISVITVVFKDDVDIYFARQLVFQRLTEVEQDIPDGAAVEMGPVATAMGEIYQYTLSGEEPEDDQERVLYLTELRTVQEWIISPMLKGIPGVSEVNSFGGYLKQFIVAVNPDRLLQYGLSVGDVYQAIQENNRNVGGSILDRYSEQFIVRGIGLVRSEQDLQNIVLRSVDGTPVYVKDVAEVQMGQAVRQGAALKNGRECVGGIVMMLRDENSKEIVNRVRDKVEEINRSHVLPDGLRIESFYERSDIVQSSVNTVTRALREGALLVVIILYLFLRNIRGALIILLALPLSLFLTFMVMKAIGLDANLMSFAGLAISIGMIIDATIIQVENVQRHLSQPQARGHRLATVLKAVLEVRKPSIFGELIIAVTFLPVFALQGMEGKMFTPLALTKTVALLSSLLLSIFVIPVLCGLLLRPGSEKESLIVRLARRMYCPVLQFSLKRKWLVIGAAILLFVIAVVIVPRLGTEFIPIMDEGAFDMDVQFLPGISLEKSVEMSQLIETRLMQFPELVTIVGRTGQTGIALEARGVDKTGYVGVLKPRSEWTSARNREELTEKMRDAVDDIPGMVFSFSQPIQCRIDELVAGTRAQLIVRIFGDDMDLLKSKAEEMAQVLSGLEGTADLLVERIAGQPYLNISVDRAKIARHGVNVADVLEVVEVAVGGKVATQLYEESRFFDVVVRYPEERRNSPEVIGATLVSCPGGYLVPLNQLADFAVVEGPVQISRQDGQRCIGIELNIEGMDIGRYVAQAREQIRENIDLPGGYYLTWGGQFENQQRAMKRLMVIAPLTVGLIFLFLFVTFGSSRLALLVILNLPFALIGGVLALFLSGQYLSVPASVGFIVLFGVAVLNGLVLVSYISQLRQEGVPLLEAIQGGCTNRLRPVLMTASIAIFSLIPLLFATGPGSEIQRPMATVVIGGLFTSTLLTMVLLPTLYAWFEKPKTEEEL